MFNKPWQIWVAGGLVAASLALAGCGGGGGSEPTAPPATQGVQVDATRSFTTTVGPAGGQVTATAADGRRYTLTVPAGALASNTAITATPITAMGNAPLATGLQAAVRYQPSGLRFALAATLRIEGTQTPVANGKRLAGFVRSENGQAMGLVPATARADALEVDVRHFSDVGVSQVSPAELALVPALPLEPLVTVDSVVEELADAATRALPVNPSTAQLAEAMAALHDAIVRRELDLATNAANRSAREVAVAAFGAWHRLIDRTAGDAAQAQAVIAALGDRYVLARARAGAFVKQDVEAGLAQCLAPLPLGAAHLAGLEGALLNQVIAARNGLDGADLGLDADTLGRRANTCARLAFVPKALPALAVGRAVSLDTQAELVFAADANFRSPAKLAFEVASVSAQIARPSGLGSLQGEYTTGVTPTALEPAFDIKACLAVTLPSGGPVPSALCSRTTLGGPAVIVLAGEVTFLAGRPLVAIGSVALRLRFDSEGHFTVLQALGSVAQSSSGTVDECFPFPINGRPVVRNIRLNFSSQGSITDGRQFDELLAGQFIGFLLTGSHVTTVDELQADCSVSTRTVTSANAASVQILQIERDAQGRPAALVMGDLTGSLTGRLVRQ